MSNACAWPCRADTDWRRATRVRLSAAAGEPFVALGEQSGLRQLTDALCGEEDLDPDIVFEATEIPTMEGLVAAGFGVAVVPVPRRRRRIRRAVHVPLSNVGAKREVGLVWDPSERSRRRRTASSHFSRSRSNRPSQPISDDAVDA